LSNYRPIAAQDAPRLRDEYWRAALVYHVVDGDTADIEIDLGHRLRADARLRTLYINTPELRASDAAVRAKAREAMRFFSAWLDEHAAHNTISLTWGGREVTPFNLRTEKADAFGRWLTVIQCQLDHDAGQALLDANLAVPFAP